MGTTFTGTFVPQTNQDIVSLYVDQFSDNFIMKAQEKESHLLSTVEQEDMHGLQMFVDGCEALSDTDSNMPATPTARFADTVLYNTKFFKRRIRDTEWQWAELIEKGDKKRSLTSPQSKIIENAMAAFNRQLDNQIITSALGDADQVYRKTDKTQQEDTIALPESQKIKDSSQQGFTYNRFLEVEELLRSNGVNVDYDPVFFILGPKQNHQAKLDDKFINSLYTEDHPLREGAKLPAINNTFFIVSNELPTTGSTRRCLAYVPSGIRLGIEELFDISLGPRLDKQMANQVFIKRSYGAVRTDEAKVVEFQCNESGNLTV